MKKNDLRGHRFGSLIALKYVGDLYGPKKNQWKCSCDCGEISHVSTHKLTSGHTTSCGCMQPILCKEANTTHGMTDTGTYRVWQNMLRRCFVPSSKQFKDYGGRGITVCDEWRNFEGFLASMGKRPEGLTLERNDNDKGYCPSNCRWATRDEQARNSRRNKWLEYGGERKVVSDWAIHLGVSKSRIHWRLNHGASVAEALDPNPQPKGPRRYRRGPTV
jgi:hypothetical protein